ncbi:hypothetical protein JW964_16880 [candidate division KSB1 bacterium]|nr:hypothetical protein [candidate division KSB1 bacterium]
MKKIWIGIFLILVINFALAENYLVNGGQKSRLNYQLTQEIVPVPGMNDLELSFVLPQTFVSPTYNQQIFNLKIEFQPQPTNRKERVDQRGNKILEVNWANPNHRIKTMITFTAENHTKLEKLTSSASFPIKNVGADSRPYLQSTDQVASNDSQIRSRATELVRGATTQYDAVQRILSWVVDHMRYILNPPSYDALYSYQTGKGNCQNYSHLTAALMRSVGIPVRIVNGVTLKRPYEIETPQGTLIMKIAQGRHSWIEVFFEDLGWVPFDPQQTQLFVSNRFIRIEVGIDNQETIQDGLLRWSMSGTDSGQPQFEEAIEAEFAQDQVAIRGEKQSYGPKNLLLTPPVQTNFIPYQSQKETPEPPPVIRPDDIKRLPFQKSAFLGNLEFPAGLDFTTVHGPVQVMKDNHYEMQKNFLVETAEYVTSQDQYAQVFLLDKPMKLENIGLAIHKFGGSGNIWIEILKDDKGVPGDLIATSEIILVDDMRFKVGYNWEYFDFSKQNTLLTPGYYWIALGFTGDPIMNWFYTYGKPVGPQWGTRYKTMFETAWSKSLSYEFNYRIQGKN